MNRIKNKFDQLKNSNKKALGIFLTAGDPDFETSLKIIEKLPAKGVDFIEIGMPFSDPMADGPSIQLSSQRALKSGMNIKKCFMLVENFRKKNSDIPIILMGYFNPIYIFGKTKFIDQCKKSGVDGLIIVDLPPEEDEELYIEAENKKLSCIRLVTPTTHNTRLAKILSNATGFIYYVSITGITGTQSPETGHVSSNIKNIKSFSDLPIVVGFGIRSPNQALSMAQISDGVVIGSAVIDLIKESLDENGNSTEITANSCLDFIHEVSKEMKHN
jgi:tryptophan synthase alpha chain